MSRGFPDVLNFSIGGSSTGNKSIENVLLSMKFFLNGVPVEGAKVKYKNFIHHLVLHN